MATYPGRFDTLQEVVMALLPQLDKLYVYVNGADSIPECLKHEKIVALLGKNHDGDLSATGKIYPLKLIKKGYYFTFDDDFIYPDNYVSNLIDAIDKFNRKAVVTVHGSLFAPDVDWYYERSKGYAVRQALNEYKFIHLPGSATVAFHTSTLKVQYEDFPREPMVDLRFGTLALEQNVPIIAIPRPKGWIKFLELEGLWEANLEVITHHTPATIKAGPWNFERFRKIYRPFIDQLDKNGLERLDSDVLDCLEEGVPQTWGETPQAVSSRLKHIELIQKLNNTHRISRFLKKIVRSVKGNLVLYKAKISRNIKKYI